MDRLGNWREGKQALRAANAECATRQEQVLAVLVSDMGDPDSVIAEWQNIMAVPLPLPLPLLSLAKIVSFTKQIVGENFIDPSFRTILRWETTDASTVNIVPESDKPFYIKVGAQGSKSFKNTLGPSLPRIDGIDKNGSVICQYAENIGIIPIPPRLLLRHRQQRPLILLKTLPMGLW